MAKGPASAHDGTTTPTTTSLTESREVLGLVSRSKRKHSFLSLPQSSSQSSWSADDYLDLHYSMISNTFFFAGACCQTFISVWDWKSAVDYASGLVVDDDNASVPYVYTLCDKTYYCIYTLGPLLYLCNSLVDIRWSMAFLTFPNVGICGFCVDKRSDDRCSSNDCAMPSSQSSLSPASASTSSSAVEMEERWWGLVVAIVFGLGAICEIYSTVLDDVYEDADDFDDDHYLIKVENRRKWFVSNYKMTTIAMHLYLLSGIIQLISQRKSHRGSHVAVCCGGGGGGGGKKRQSRRFEMDPEADPINVTSEESTVDSFAAWIMMVGTLLFVLGTLIDCTISYIYDPQVLNEIDHNKIITINDVVLAQCDVTSSIFWNIDAVLYIVADVLVYRLYDRTGSSWKLFFWTAFKRHPGRDESVLWGNSAAVASCDSRYLDAALVHFAVKS